MAQLLSSITHATDSCCSGNCAALRVDRRPLAGFIEPVLQFVEFRMNGPTYAPQPLAGFAAVSCVLEDSVGGLRNRDSLGGDHVTPPGGIVWTQAGSGIIHDGFPAEVGREVHGLYVFINSSRCNKLRAPQVYRADTAGVPVVHDATGGRTRVLAGRHADATGPVAPQEPFDFLDVRVGRQWRHDIPRRRNTLLYVIEGDVLAGTGAESRRLAAHDAVGIRGDDAGGALTLESAAGARVLVLSGADPGEPMVEYGTFIMNTEADVTAAYERYRDGGMGRLNVTAPTEYLPTTGNPGASGRAGAN